MSSASYTSGSTGRTIDLDGRNVHIGAAEGLRGYAWEYELGAKSAENRVRRARKADLTVWVSDLETADTLRDMVDADMEAGTPGTLSFGEWSQRALFAEMEQGTVSASGSIMDFAVLLLDGAWGRERTVRFGAGADDSGRGAHGYPHDYPHDFGSPASTGSVLVGGTGASPCRIVFYGACTDPFAVIGENAYQWIGEVPAGGYVDIDGRTGRTVTLVRADGSREDVFRGAVRTGGERGGTYAFAPLQAGLQSVSWPQTYGFDLTYVERRSAPPYTL